jgi:hypothetical protein
MEPLEELARIEARPRPRAVSEPSLRAVATLDTAARLLLGGRLTGDGTRFRR